jgi:IMP cyclohydrolase
VLSIEILIVLNEIEKKLRSGLENLARREYPGRIIIIGEDQAGKNVVVIYGITGRSPSSQARKLFQEEDAVWVRPTDEEMLKKGKIELLVYPAICLSEGIVVSNGRQSLDIESRFARIQNPSEILASALSKWDYEPDPPIYTPRISGCVASSQRAALSIIKRGEDGSSLRNIFEIPMILGKGWMISTYKGDNKEPLEPFSGEPMEIKLDEDNPGDTAQAVYEALAPSEGKDDFRVAVVCVFSPDLESKIFDISIINRIGREGS